MLFSVLSRGGGEKRGEKGEEEIVLTRKQGIACLLSAYLKNYDPKQITSVR